MSFPLIRKPVRGEFFEKNPAVCSGKIQKKTAVCSGKIQRKNLQYVQENSGKISAVCQEKMVDK
jgi:ribosomal protein L19